MLDGIALLHTCKVMSQIPTMEAVLEEMSSNFYYYSSKTRWGSLGFFVSWLKLSLLNELGALATFARSVKVQPPPSEVDGPPSHGQVSPASGWALHPQVIHSLSSKADGPTDQPRYSTVRCKLAAMVQAVSSPPPSNAPTPRLSIGDCSMQWWPTCRANT